MLGKTNPLPHIVGRVFQLAADHGLERNAVEPGSNRPGRVRDSNYGVAAATSVGDERRFAAIGVAARNALAPDYQVTLGASILGLKQQAAQRRRTDRGDS